MEERKNNTGLIVLITVLVMLVLGMGAFIIYDKVINKINEPNSEENNNDKITYTDYDLESAKTLIAKYYIRDRGVSTFDKMDDNDKALIAFHKLNDSSFNTATCQSIYGKNEYWYKDTFMGCQSPYDVRTFDYEIINKEYQKLFGNNENLKKQDFENMEYINDKNIFVELMYFAGGDAIWPHIMYDVLSAKLSSEDKLIINVGYVKFDVDTEKEEIYSPSFDSTITYKDVDDIESSFITDYSDKVTKLEFVFEKENGNFVLKSFTRK